MAAPSSHLIFVQVRATEQFLNRFIKKRFITPTTGTGGGGGRTIIAKVHFESEH